MPISSIFKHHSNSAISKIAKESLHLPVLDKKGRNIFAQDHLAQNPQKKGRIIRLPVDRLKPLDSQQVRKRFLQKYGRSQVNE